jgi:hypothetical protein
MAGGRGSVRRGHGEPIGYYIPLRHRGQAEKAAAMKRLGDSMERLRIATGLSLQEFEAELTRGLPGRSD